MLFSSNNKVWNKTKLIKIYFNQENIMKIKCNIEKLKPEIFKQLYTYNSEGCNDL